MERTLTFTLTLEKDGGEDLPWMKADITILEGESGDVVSYPVFYYGDRTFEGEAWQDTARYIENEIYGWFSIMAEEMEDNA